MNKTQIEETAQRGGNILSTALSLARPLLAPAAKALATAGLTFGAEKVLKKIFGNGYGPREIKLYQLTRKLSPAQKKEVEKMLIGQGLVRGGGIAQFGGFLGMLASIGISLAIDLVKKIVGKGMQPYAPRSRPRRSLGFQRRAPTAPRGRGMQINPSWWRSPPVVGRVEG